jgi:hypothetical protein
MPFVNEKGRTRGPFLDRDEADVAGSGSKARHAFFTFSSILKMPFGAPTNMRLNVLGKQRRSSVLRRVRVRSANSFSSFREAHALRADDEL